MFTSMRNFTAITGSLLLAASTLSAVEPSLATKSFKPANPDKYPYPMYMDEVKDGKKVKTLYDGAIIKQQSFDVNHVYHSPISGKGFKLGEKATKEQTTAWNTDVRPDGKGLPDGSMTVAEGMQVYIKNCGHCHGDFGEGVDKFPILSGGFGTLTLQPKSGAEAGPEKTIGSYGSHIAPLYWYIQTAMPLSAPKSLTNSEVYGILGYLLQVNEIQVNGQDVEDETVVDRAFIKAVHMPNEDGFVYNDLRNPLAQNTRCMENCIDTGDMEILRIQTDATEVEPEFGEERYFFGEIEEKSGGEASPGETTYATFCSGCHAEGLVGAHKLDDKKAWAKVMEKGMDAVVQNSINGIGGMPPKGGAMDLTDEQMREAVEYMVNHSK